jgi:hypothetical protein
VVQPSVTGKPQELQSLAALPGTWAGTTPISIGYQWRRCDPQGATCSDILGATGSVYTPTSADVGFTIRVLVTASNVAGNQLVVQAPYNQVVGQDSPAGFWRLDETSGKVAADASGNGNPGAYSSGPTLGLPGALLDPADKSIGLNGVDQRVIVTPTNGLLDFGTSNFTVEVWLKTAVNIEEAAISKQTLTGPYWDVTVTDDPGHVGQVRAKIYDGNVTRTVYGPTLRVDDNKWHYVAVEYDRANGITVYVDGLSKFTAGSSPGDVTNSSPLRIGFAANFPYFTGDLDEAAAYPSLLSKARLDAHYRAGVDDTAPTPTLTGPPPDVITGNPLPTFSGVAGTVVGDQSSVTVSVYSGGSATGTPVETMHTTAGGDGSWSVPGASPLPAGTYTVQVTQADLAGNVGTSPPDTFSVSGDPVIAAAGDIACDPANKFFGGVSPSACQDAATARLMAGGGYAAVLPIGDEQYDCGAYDVFMQSYDKTWGQFNSIAHPVPGNHEYHSVGLNNTTDCGGSNASGYFQYFGSSAGPAGTGWYSYDIGAWHIVALNTNCDYIGGCDVGSPEEQWLAGDLAAHPAQCTLAYFHHPRWSTDAAGDDPTISSIWQDLYAAGVDVVLNGHAHSYQRFAPQDPNGTADPSNGIREFVVGTGGDGTSSFSPVTPNLTVRNGNTYGVLNLALHANGYTWSFVPVSGSTFTDSGSGTCH